MHRPRVIPVLTVRREGLVKTRRFAEGRYIGDPLNAVRLFDELGADELMLLDIDATREGRCISTSLVKAAGEEANMPLCVGGGIRALSQIRALLSAGAEKVVLGTEAVENPSFVRAASEHFGSSTVVVCVDVMTHHGLATVFCASCTRPTSHDPIELACRLEEQGAGEIIVQSIDRDGTMSGYDIALIRRVSAAVGIPVIALGGAGSPSDLREAYVEGHASAVAAGSLFVMHGPHRGVLINYPERRELPF